MTLESIREQHKRRWKRIKAQWYYGCLVISVFSAVYAIFGLVFPGTDSLYVNEYACIAVSLVSLSIAWKLRKNHL